MSLSLLATKVKQCICDGKPMTSRSKAFDSGRYMFGHLVVIAMLSCGGKQIRLCCDSHSWLDCSSGLIMAHER